MASPQDYIAFHQTYGCTNQTTRTVKRQIVVIAVPGTEWIDGREEPAEYTKQFFPINELRAILVPKTVQAILRHRCDYCQQQTLWLPKPDIDKSVDHIVGTSSNHPSLARTAITIFALLIYIENPLLIFSFLQKGDNDDTFAKNTETYEPVRLYEIWRDFHTHHTRASEEVARNFRTQKWHFAIPHMSHGEHTRYQSRHMLPFAMQKELGLHTGAQQQESELDRDRIGHDRGGNGKVFKVELHPGYGNFGRAEVC